MYRVADILKRTPDIANNIATIIGNNKNLIEKAGSVGVLISIGIEIYQQIRKDLKTKEELAFGSLMKIAFECAQESIPEEGNTIELKNVKSEVIREELFETFLKVEGWDNYLPDHPVIVQFRTLICDLLKYEQCHNLRRDFVFNFNINLEHKAGKDPDLAPFMDMTILIEDYKNLREHLEKSRSP